VILFPLVFSCLSQLTVAQFVPKNSALDVWPTDSWSTSTPEEQGMNSTYLSMMYDYIYNNSLDIGSILIIRNGIIVEEAYLEDSQVDESMTQPSSDYNWGTVIYNNEGYLRNWFSTTKSISALLIGIAIQNGFIDNISQTFFEFFPEKWNSSLDTRKLNITIEHLLRMTSGIPWPFQPVFWSIYSEEDNPDYINDVLALDLTNDPGDPFDSFDVQYSTDATNLLTAILNRSTGMYPEDFARQYLFEPIGIEEEDWGWYKGATGINWGGSGLCMHRRSMAKLAYLCHMNGTWDGTQILSNNFLQEVVSPGSGSMGSYYGYLFYLDNYSTTYDFYRTGGAFGQNFYVVPELDLIFLVNGWDYEEPSRDILLTDYIIPSILNYEEPEPSGDTSIPGMPISLLSICILTILAITIRKEKEEVTYRKE